MPILSARHPLRSLALASVVVFLAVSTQSWTNVNAHSTLTEHGCYIDAPGIGVGRFFDGATKLFGLTNSPQQCAQFCRTKGFRWFGLENTDSCWCGLNGDSLGTHTVAGDGECDNPCPGGDGSEMCGAEYRIRVFNIDENLTPPLLSLTHIGCHVDSSTRLLSSAVTRSFDHLDLDVCSQWCAQRGYSFFGVEAAHECRCGDALENTGTNVPVDMSECSDPCPGNDYQLCGSSWRINVFSIETNGPDATYSLVDHGCFVDDPIRFLPLDSTDFPDFNSIDTCLRFCRNNGFSFFGMAGTDSDKCRCGSALPSAPLIALPSDGDSECAFACPGNENEACGALWRLNVFEIVESSPA